MGRGSYAAGRTASAARVLPALLAFAALLAGGAAAQTDAPADWVFSANLPTSCAATSAAAAATCVAGAIGRPSSSIDMRVWVASTRFASWAFAGANATAESRALGAHTRAEAAALYGITSFTVERSPSGGGGGTPAPPGGSPPEESDDPKSLGARLAERIIPALLFFAVVSAVLYWWRRRRQRQIEERIRMQHQQNDAQLAVPMVAVAGVPAAGPPPPMGGMPSYGAPPSAGPNPLSGGSGKPPPPVPPNGRGDADERPYGSANYL